MEIRVLAVGDVVGKPGLAFLKKQLWSLRRKHRVHFCVVNGENAAMVGMTPGQGEEILDAGADVITLGNHTWNRREICNWLDDTDRCLRPANFAPQLPGRGYGVFESDAGPIAVINLIGRCGMDFNPDNPFTKTDGILNRLDEVPVLVDFHAEATSEKLAMGFMLDGKISALWGTHTHVPTADTQVLPGGTGYVTDLGMTGPSQSVLGIRPELSIAKFRGDLPNRYQWANGPTKMEAVLFTIDAETGKCRKAERVDLNDENSSQR